MGLLEIAIDAKQMTGRPTGVGRVLEGVLEGLGRLEDPGVKVRSLGLGRGGGTLSWVQLALPRHARGADVLHCPFYYRPIWSPCPVVVAIFDVLVVTHPEWFPPRGRHPFRELLLWSAKHAAGVVTGSEHVLAELESLVGPLEERGFVVPLGVSSRRFFVRKPEASAKVCGRLGFRGPYLLSLGSLHPRRGLATALEALALLLDRRPELKLVIAGKEEHRWGRIPAALAEHVVVTGYLPEEDLPPLMSGASAMLSLSRGEGFDLPLLEALACGTPVVASDIDVHREHFAEWARMVPVGDAEAVASAVESILRDPPALEAREGQAAAVHARFRWQDSARAHVEVWRRVARTGKRR